MAPVRPVVRIYTLDGTGQTELRGHVANWVQGGPEFVRNVPLMPDEVEVLLVRRFPKVANRKQRVPFVVSRRRLEAALDEAERSHLAFQKNRMVQHGLVVPVDRKNLDAYAEGEEPDGMKVSVVEQMEDLVLDEELFKLWMDKRLVHQLNVQVRAHLVEVLGTDDDEITLEMAWSVVCDNVRRAVEEQAVGEAGPCGVASGKGFRLEDVCRLSLIHI